MTGDLEIDNHRNVKNVLMGLENVIEEGMDDIRTLDTVVLYIHTLIDISIVRGYT